MADYLIQDTTLDAIADAINAKTGGSSAMTPAQMVTAIGSISGGGEKVFTKLGEATVVEPVQIINVSITEQMKNCECLYLVCDSIVLSAADWVYPNLNNSVMFGYTSKSSELSAMFAFAPIKKPTWFTRRNAIANTVTGFTTGNGITHNSLSTIGLSAYTSGITFTSGKIEVWGYV